MGRVGYSLIPSRWKIARHNIQKAFPEKSSAELDELTKQHFFHVGRVVIDLFSLPAMSSERLRKEKLRFKGLEQVYELQKDKQGGLFISAHIGSWESLCISPTKGFDVYVLYRIQRGFFEDLIMSLRTSCGLKLLPNDVEGVKNLLHRAYDGGFVAMLADQGKGATFDFFGYPAQFPWGAAVFHVRHKLKAFPIFSMRDAEGHILVEVCPPIEVDGKLKRSEREKQFQEKYIKVLEEKVREAPEQYYWLHDIWRDFK